MTLQTWLDLPKVASVVPGIPEADPGFSEEGSEYLKKGVWGITSEAVWVYILKTLKSLHDFEHMFEELSITKSVANLGEELGGYGPLPP